MKKIKNLLIKIKNKIFEERGGSLIEYALIIGFSIVSFIIIIGIIMSVLDWSTNSLNHFFDFLNK